MRVWAVANQKGGVGKTTTLVTLAGLLAEQGKRVVLVDLDPHGSMTAWFHHNPDDIAATSGYQLFRHKGLVPKGLTHSLLLPTSHENVRLIGATPLLATLERNFNSERAPGLVVTRALAQLWADFDYALIDTPPLLGVLMVNAIAAAHKLLVPVATEFLALKGLERMQRSISMISKSRGKPIDYTIVPTLFDRRTQSANASLQQLQERYVGTLWPSVIPVDPKVREAAMLGLFPSQLSAHSRAVTAYSALLAHLETPALERV
ncbi:MAG TPA: ParA family protein [Pseudomonadales bacterium]|nr:ParA family protein [Pseudomonadales bacterium]